MRIGIFGGTFDPPHRGHLVLAREAFHHLNLDRLLWVLTADPPHKQGQPITALEHRLEMTRLVLERKPRFELSRIEIDRPGPHYALHTVRFLAARHPGDQLIYLMGGDSLNDLPAWYHPLELLQACHEIGVMRRPGEIIDLPALDVILPGLQDKVHFFDAPLLKISSSEIRRRIAQGEYYQSLVTRPVFQYIQSHHLYQIKNPHQAHSS